MISIRDRVDVISWTYSMQLSILGEVITTSTRQLQASSTVIRQMLATLPSQDDAVIPVDIGLAKAEMVQCLAMLEPPCNVPLTPENVAFAVKFADFFDIPWLQRRIDEFMRWQLASYNHYITPGCCFACEEPCDKKVWFCLKCRKETGDHHCRTCNTNLNTRYISLCVTCDSQMSEGRKCPGCGKTPPGNVVPEMMPRSAFGEQFWYCLGCKSVPARHFYHCDACETNRHTKSMWVCRACTVRFLSIERAKQNLEK